MDLEKVKDKWVVCSTPKHGYSGNSLLFWGKNDCGHYADLEECEFYTEGQAKARCHKHTPCVAIPVMDLIPYMKTQVVSAGEVLNKWESIKNLEFTVKG